MIKKLTLKQRKFVVGYIENGGNGTQAAMNVYNAKNYNTAHTIASENLQKPTIREAIDGALRTKGLTPDVITGNLGNLANSKPEKVSGDTVLKANVEVLKLMGAYPGSKHTTVNVSFKAKLKDMKYQDLKKYVEEMRQNNDELIKEIEELENPHTT